MDWWEIPIIAALGVLAGAVNTVVGSASLLTFPVLLALGYPPLTANVSNSLGLTPGSISGAIGFRAEIADQWFQLRRLGVAAIAGGVFGALLLMMSPADSFTALVPVLIAVAVVLVIAQPRISEWIDRRTTEGPDRHRVLLPAAVFLVGSYGGYFGAAQGVLLLAILGVLYDAEPVAANAMKNALTAGGNLIAGMVYLGTDFLRPGADINGWVVALLAIGSIVGGQLGVRLARRISPTVLRAAIVTAGLAAIAHFLLT